MNTRNMKKVLVAFSACLLLAACDKEFDTPPVQSLPEGSVITVQELRDLFAGSEVRFSEPKSVYGVVTADETSGNLYKSVYMQDHTAAINLRIPFSGGLYQGDSIRIYLPGTILSSYNGMLQLDSVDVDNNVVKQAVNVFKAPELVTIPQITSATQAKLIRLEDVEFKSSELSFTYSDPINQSTQNRILVDCDDNEVLVRTSGYANFAGEAIPLGNGDFVAVVSEFQGTMQLYIRNIDEIKMDSVRCDGMGVTTCPPGGAFTQGFDNVVDNVDFVENCWLNLPTTGSRVWRGDEFQGEKRLQATAYNSSNAQDIMWLVSPNTQYTAGMSLSFETQKAFYTHDPFDVFISTDFNGINVSAATWTAISATEAGAADPDNTWIPSGSIALDQYLPAGYTGNFYVGFRYSGSGTSSQTTSYRIDNIVIQ